MSWHQAMVFMATISTVSLGIGIAFATMGFWVILPFAGLELLALGAGLYVSMRGNDYREVVTVTGERVTVEFGRAGVSERDIKDYARAWARVRLEPAQGRTGRSRLLLGSSGQFVELGRCLTDAERDRLRQRLQDVLAAPAATWRSE
ncbi:MAG: DUF2244 domain-containing protein [Abyssibacter sp.]|nr:DUF2244 domain-containing protein [Abyssibacter sp.]